MQSINSGVFSDANKASVESEGKIPTDVKWKLRTTPTDVFLKRVRELSGIGASDADMKKGSSDEDWARKYLDNRHDAFKRMDEEWREAHPEE